MSISFNANQVATLMMVTSIEQERLRNPDYLFTGMDSELLLIERAYARFDRELNLYRENKSVGMSMVRKYHRMLIDVLDSWHATYCGSDLVK